MSTPQIKPFHELTEFQQWTICFIETKKKMQLQVEQEIENFCDNTKKNIDLNNYDQNIASLQNELDHLHKTGLIQSNGTYFVFSKKGMIYCFQNLDDILDKLNKSSIIQKIKMSSLFRKNQRLGTVIINQKTFSRIAPLLIINKKESMENIRFFVQLLIMLLGF